MLEPTDTTIAAWIGPATVTLAPEDITKYRDIVEYAVTKITASNAPDLVAIAHRIGLPGANDWLTEIIRTKKDDFVAVNNADLLARVACCIAVRSLNTGRDPATLIALLVQSASFLGATTPIGELGSHADAVIASAASEARRRPADWIPIEDEITSFIAEEDKAEGHKRAFVRIAAAIDDLAEREEQRAKAVDEEYDALWWSYTSRSAGGDRWEDVDPISRRLVLATHELSEKVTQVPGPPMVRGLLGLALGGQVATQITLAEVALAAANERVNVVPKANNQLLPISSAVAQIAALGSDSETWKVVLSKTLGLQATLTTSALDAALQLFREVEIGTYLE